MKRLILLLAICSPLAGQVIIDLGSTTQIKTNATLPDTGGGALGTAPYSNYPFTSGSAAILYPWSTCVIDPVLGVMVCKGGGHSDTHDSSIQKLIYSGSSPAMSLWHNPDPWCNNGINGNTDHTYCGLTTLNGSITASATTLNLTSATGFPLAGQGYGGASQSYSIDIENEQILINGGFGTTTLTGLRGQNNAYFLSAVSPSDVTLTIPSPCGNAYLFPAPPFSILAASEQILVNTVSSSTCGSPATWGVSRAQGGTTAASHGINSLFTEYGGVAHSSGVSIATYGIGDSTANCPSGSPSYCQLNSNNTPAAQHGFGGLAALPTQHAIMLMGGGYPSGDVLPYVWWLGEDSTACGAAAVPCWLPKNPLPDAGVTCSSIGITCDPLTTSPDGSGYELTYMSTTDTVFVRGESGGSSWIYNPATNKFKWLGSITQVGSGVQCDFSPAANLLYCMGSTIGQPPPGDGSFAALSINPATGAQTSITTTGCSTGMFAPWPGFSYDQHTTNFVGYPGLGVNTNTVYIFTPSTGTCTSKTISGPTVPAPPSNMIGVFGKWRYTSNLSGTFVFVGAGGVTGDAYLFQVDGIAPTITSTSPIPSGTHGTSYSYTFTATGTPSSFTWSVVSGSLPPGCSSGLSSSGVLSCTPTAGGTYNFTVSVSNGVTPNATLPVTWVVAPLCTITSFSIPIGRD